MRCGAAQGSYSEAPDPARWPLARGKGARPEPAAHRRVPLRTDLYTMRALITLLLTLPFILHAQQWNWAASAGGGGNSDFCHGIATDSQGNVYWVGSVSGTANFGCGTLTPGSTIAGFVAKRSADGVCQWVRGITVGFNQAWAYGVAIDAEDRIYVTGKYNGNATFGDGVTLGSLGSDDIFLARYDTAGTCLWARRAGSSGSSDEARAIAVSDDGGVFIAGFSGGTTIGFDNVSIPNPGNFRQLVIAHYDSTGTVQWARASAGNGLSKTCRAITVAGDRLFVTGQLGATTASYDGIPLTPAVTGTSVYVLATDLQGEGLWANSFGSGDHEGLGIAADTLGNVFVAGRMWGTMTLPDTVLTSNGSNDDILLMGFGQDGTYRWGKNTGSPVRDLAWGITADGKGNAYVAVQFQQTIDFFGTPVSALGGEDALIAKLRADGDVVWWSRPSGFQRDVPLCIHRRSVEPHALYFGGYYWGTITYGNSTIMHVNNGDAMLVGGLDSTFAVNVYAAPICPGGCDGVAHAFTNGDAPFSYLWSTGATTPTIGGLCTGTYVVEVTDGNGQLLVDPVLVAEHIDPGYTVQVEGDSLWTTGGASWAWYLNSTLLVSDSASAVAMANGDYHALVTDAYGCEWSTDTVQVITTAVIDVAKHGLRAWPNPMTDILHVEGVPPGTRLELHDALGRMVWRGQASSVRTNIALNGLAPGSYLLRSEIGIVIKLVR